MTMVIFTCATNLNNGSKFAVIIIYLFKTFDCLNHELLLAKLKAYGLDNYSVTFTRNYLANSP